MTHITKQEMKTLLKSQQGEINAVWMYKALADKVSDATDAATFRKLASEEGHHAAIFKKLTQKVLRPQKTMAVVIPLLYTLLGRRRLYRIIAKGEYKASHTYKSVAARFPEIESVMADEQRHGDMVMALIS